MTKECTFDQFMAGTPGMREAIAYANSRAAVQAWEVRAGKIVRHYATEYHAEQLARALRLNGMDVTVEAVRLPNDALTRKVLA